MVAAVALGWEVADLYAERRREPAHIVLGDTLPTIDNLGPGRRAEARMASVAVLTRRALAAHPKSAARRLTESLPTLPQAGGAEKAIYDLHVDLITTLQAHDTALFHAYDLGRSLADTCRDTDDLGGLMDRLEPGRLLPIEGRLADLSSRLPPHAAAAVAATLEQWRGWTGEARAREDMNGVRGALSRQGALWRALLTGEKEAIEMLDPDMVVAASVRHASRLGTMIRGLAGAYLPAVGLVVLVTALLLYVILEGSGIATVIATLGALAAVLIVIRKGLSLTVQDTIGELRGRLWGAEIDAAVAHSILRLPPSAPAAKRTRLSLAKPASEIERPTMTQRVERALHVTNSAKQQGLRVPAAGPDAAAQPQQDDGASANGHSGA